MHLSLCQSLVAKALGVPANRVVVRVKRMGGGFGGKESRTTVLSTVVAVAANKYVWQSFNSIRFSYLETKCKISYYFSALLCQAEEACEVYVGQRRGHVGHWRKTSLLWKIQGRRSPPAGEAAVALAGILAGIEFIELYCSPSVAPGGFSKQR